MAEELKSQKMSLIDLLPAIYQEPGTAGQVNYLPQFLDAFDTVLFGNSKEGESTAHEAAPVGTEKTQGLRDEIVQMARLLDPYSTPDSFLPWLASWVGLSLQMNLKAERKRALVAKIIPLYRIRGTKRYLQELLELCDVKATVQEVEEPALQIGKVSKVGEDMYVGGSAPHFFRVKLVAPPPSSGAGSKGLSVSSLENLRKLASEIVELAKPAHTSYELLLHFPNMQIRVHSTVGVDTVLGPAQAVWKESGRAN